MNILFLSAEVAPYVTVGGLSQVMYFLPRALNKRGFDVRIFTPKYGVTKLKKYNGSPPKLQHELMQMPVPTGKGKEELICNVLKYRPKHRNDAQMYFLENREYYELRENVFGYADDHTRFALLSKGCLEWLLSQYELKKKKKNVWWPEVIHCHDWHTSYFIEMARRDPRYKAALAKIPIVLSVHNFKYQGMRDFRFLKEEEKDFGDKPLAAITSDDLKAQNALLRGLLYADAISTVSPTHAIEVLTPEYSEGLLDTLITVRSKLTGIMNGLDLEEFNPATDPIIRKQYNKSSFLTARRKNKLHLQREFQLPEDAEVPLFGFVGRLAQQKGIDLIVEAIPHILDEWPRTQFVVLGTGDEKYRNALTELRDRYPENIGLFLFSDFKLPRKVFGGADVMLMPSMFEPGGIVALEALRYGAVPIVRETGGLRDIVQHFDPAKKKGNGFVFSNKNAWALYGTICEVLAIHRQPKLWERLVRNALNTQLTWDDAAAEYDDLYHRTARERKRVLRRC